MSLMKYVFNQYFDNDGLPLNAGTVTARDAGTVNLKDFYSDSDLTTPLDNPTTLPSTGRLTAYLESGTYDFLIKDSAGNLLDTVENVSSSGGSSLTEPSTRVETISELRALALTYSTVMVTGYDADGDGGGDWYYWDSDSTDSDDGGLVIEPNSSPATGRWKRLFSRPVDLKTFGATTDNLGVFTDNFEVGGESNDGAEKYTDTSFANAAEWQVGGDFSVTGGKMQFTQSAGLGTFYQQISDMVTPLEADKWYVVRMKFDVDIPDGGKIVADIISDASYTTTVASFDGVAANEYTTIYFKTQAGETNPYLYFTATGIVSNFSITDISIKESGGVLESKSYGRFQNGLDFGTGDGTGPNDYATLARIAHDQEDSGNGDTLRVELVQSNAVFEISTHEGLKRFWTKGGSDPDIKLWPNVGSSVTPSLDIYGYKSGDSQRTMSIGIDSTYNNTGFIGNSSTALSTLRVGADKILMNTTAGIKYDMFGGIGLGYQTDTFELIGADADTDYRWGYGTSGSLTEKMHLDGGTGALKVAGQIGTTVPMNDTVSITASGLAPRFHLEDVTKAYDSLGRIYTFENNAGDFNLYYGKSDTNGQGGAPADLTTLMNIDDTYGTFGINGSGSTEALFKLTGSKTLGTSRAFESNADLTAASGTSMRQMLCSGSLTTQDNTVTYSGCYGVEISEPDITKGATDTITKAASLYISGAPTEGVSNFSLLVSDGISSFGGNVGVGTTSPNLTTVYGGASVSDGETLSIVTSDTNNKLAKVEIFGYNVASNNDVGQLIFAHGGGDFTSDGEAAITAEVGSTNDEISLKFLTNPNGGSPTERMRILSSGELELQNDIILQDSKLIRTSTSDGSDNESIYITGAGGFGVNRGAYLNLHGNEATNGAMFLYAGNTSGGDIIFNTADTEIARFGYDRVSDFSGGTVIKLPVKTDTGDPSTPSDGWMYVNTFDNKVRVYADGSWRDLATW